MKRQTWILGVIAAAGLASGTCAMGDTILFDRGLPIQNLNNAAGASRSNVAWADSEATNAPSQYYLPGDDFTLGGSGSYQVNDIRVWAIGDTLPTGLSLLGGTGGSIGAVSSTFTVTPTAYLGGAEYQGTSGAFHQLYQIDFSVNLNLTAGQTFDFFVNSPWTASGSAYVNTFLHASNAGLSGSPQDGADGQFLWLHVNGASQNVETWFSGTGAGTAGFGAGWDKNSDANVQVLGTAAPLPSSAWAGLALLGCIGLASGTKRLRRQPA
jgi:hypothetical protein